MTDRLASDVCFITQKLSFLFPSSTLEMIEQIPLGFDILKLKTRGVKDFHSYSYCQHLKKYQFWMVKCLFSGRIVERSPSQSVTVQSPQPLPLLKIRKRVEGRRCKQVQEGPKLTSSHRHTKFTATYLAFASKKDLKTR